MARPRNIGVQEVPPGGGPSHGNGGSRMHYRRVSDARQNVENDPLLQRSPADARSYFVTKTQGCWQSVRASELTTATQALYHPRCTIHPSPITFSGAAKAPCNPARMERPLDERLPKMAIDAKTAGSVTLPSELLRR